MGGQRNPFINPRRFESGDNNVMLRRQGYRRRPCCNENELIGQDCKPQVPVVPEVPEKEDFQHSHQHDQEHCHTKKDSLLELVIKLVFSLLNHRRH